MPTTATAIRTQTHLDHGYIPWCLRCIEQETKAGTVPNASKELGFKNRGWVGR